jgi:hypothetical protein
MRLSNSAEDQKFIEAVDSRRETTLELPLLEGGRGIFYLVPVMAGEQYLGTIYVILVKAESTK